MFRIIHVVSATLPDDRLIWVDTSPNLVTFAYREGFVHSELVRDLDEMSRHVVNSGFFQLDLSRRETPSDHIRAWLVSVKDRYMGPDQTLAAHIDRARGEAHRDFEILVRQSMIRPEVIPEANEIALPTSTGLLVPVKQYLKPQPNLYL